VTYTITWKNYDGTVLETDTKVKKGATPTYDGATPTKASVGVSSYTFSGWTPSVVAVVADATYTAQFTESLGKSFNLGKYPQTVVEDSATLTALASATDTDSDGYLEYGSEEYKKVDSAAPCEAGYKSISGSTTFATGSAYYFKVEPIEWRVLFGGEAKTGLVMSEKILDVNNYYASKQSRTISSATVYANNYEYSSLRAMLNGLDFSSYVDGNKLNAGNFTGKGFLDIAFTADEKAYITTTVVDNSAATAVANTRQPTLNFSCENTRDKIFALSYKDLTNPSYGFAASATSLASRGAVLTDYARAIGAVMNTSGNGYFWSRSPYAESNNYYCVSRVGFGGDVAYSGTSGTASVGIRPAFNATIA